MKNLFVMLFGILVTGCASHDFRVGTQEFVDDHMKSSVEKVFVGIPLLAAVEGSVVSLGNGYYITAKHNSLILDLQNKDVTYHDTCDVAIFKTKEDNIHNKLGVVYKGEEVTTLGYPSSLPLTSGKGVYVGDVSLDDKGCVYSVTKATGISGMSGGAVFNDKAELVGVIVAVNNNPIDFGEGNIVKGSTIFLSTNFINQWILDVTGGGL